VAGDSGVGVIYALLRGRAGAADLGVYLAALGDDGVDGAFGMEVAAHAAEMPRAFVIPGEI